MNRLLKFFKKSYDKYTILNQENNNIQRIQNQLTQILHSSSTENQLSQVLKALLTRVPNSNTTSDPSSHYIFCKKLLFEEINSFRERLKYSRVKLLNTQKKLENMLSTFKKLIQDLGKETSKSILIAFGTKELTSLLQKLFSKKIPENIWELINILLAHCWQIKLILQEIFEINDGMDPLKAISNKFGINPKHFLFSKYIFYRIYLCYYYLN